MRVFPTWSQLPRSEKITVTLSLLIVIGIIGCFSYWANPARVTDLIKFVGLSSLGLAIGVTGHAVYKVVFAGGPESRAVEFGPWLLRHRAVVSVWIACTILTLCMFPMGNRILMDEIIVLATSKAIHEEREPVTPTMLQSYHGVLKLTAGYIDKRPYLYAAFVGLFHDLLGYSPKNAFYANMVLAALTLALVGVIGLRLGASTEAGAIAMLALTSVPLFAEHATGGGIDIINLFCILSVLTLGLVHLERPTVVSARSLLGAAVLLAYARYESIMFMAIPVTIMAVIWIREKRLFVDGYSLLLWPAILPLCGIHFLTFLRADQSFQLSELGLKDAFSLSYIPGNLSHALGFFFDAEHLLGNSAVVFVVGLVAVLLVIVAAAVRWKSIRITNTGFCFAVFALISLAGFTLLMAYSWGKLDQMVASRLSLPLYLLFVLSIAAIGREFKNRRAYGLILGVVFGASIYWSCFPVAAKRYAYKAYSIARVLEIMEEFNSRQPDRRFAVINGVTNYWLTREVYVIPPASLATNPSFLANMIESKEFRRIYLMQTLTKDEKTGLWSVKSNDSFDAPIDADVISEDLISSDTKFRISRIEFSSAAKLNESAKFADIAKPEQSGDIEIGADLTIIRATVTSSGPQ